MNELIEIEEWKITEETLTLNQKDLDFLKNDVNEGKYDNKIRIHPLGENKFKLQARQFVGEIKIPNSYTLIIKPKVGSLNFLKMLAYSENLEGIKNFDSVLAAEGEDLVDFMAKLFLDAVDVITQEGIYNTYVSQIEEIPTIKGRLLLVQNIRKPRISQEKFWCEYDEISTDVLENQILLYCAELLSNLVKGQKTKLELNEFQKFLENHGVSNFFLEPHHLDLISIQKLNIHYDRALNLCEFILNLIWYGDFKKDQKIPLQGFLYDMNNLFQNFVTKVIQNTSKNYDIYPELRNKNLLDRIYSDKTKDYQRASKVNLKPDIVIKEKGSSKTSLIIDTKYKETTSANDIYQSIAYSMAFDCPTVLLVPVIGLPVKDGFILDPDLEVNGEIYVESLDFSYEEDFLPEIIEKIKKLLATFGVNLDDTTSK